MKRRILSAVLLASVMVLAADNVWAHNGKKKGHYKHRRGHDRTVVVVPAPVVHQRTVVVTPAPVVTRTRVVVPSPVVPVPVPARVPVPVPVPVPHPPLPPHPAFR